MVVFKYNAELTHFPDTSKSGVWKDIKSDGKRTALIACPGCGKVAPIADHTIGIGGDVSPSLVCPFDCGFHEMIRLDGWEP